MQSQSINLFDMICFFIQLALMVAESINQLPWYFNCLGIIQLALMVAESIDCSFPYFPIPYGCWSVLETNTTIFKRQPSVSIRIQKNSMVWIVLFYAVNTFSWNSVHKWGLINIGLVWFLSIMRFLDFLKATWKTVSVQHYNILGSLWTPNR